MENDEENKKIATEEEVVETPEQEETNTAPETSDNAASQTPAEQTESREDEVENPSVDERIDAIENIISNLDSRFGDMEEAQEQIVTALEKISDKVLTQQKEQNSTDDAQSDATEESATEETPEESEVVENSTDDSEEDAEPEATEEESKEETKEEEEVAEESETESEPEAKEETKEENQMTKEELQEILNSFKAEVKNEILDAKVEAPAATEEKEEKVENNAPEIAKNWKTRYNDQVAAAWDFHRLGNIEAGETLRAINQYNADLRVEKNDAGDAPMTITSLAEFVLPPEMDREIHGVRTNYTPFLNQLEYQNTTALQFMYTTRVGDINMQNVAFCDDGKDGNLKPVETYGLTRGIAQMEEMAAVTPICDNATKYMAVDILADVARGYRNDYDRKLAQLAIVRFQQAVNETGNTVEYNPNTAIDSLVDFVKATTLVSEGVVNGKFVFSAKTKALLLENALRSQTQDVARDAFTAGEIQTIWGYEYVVVPNDLLPTLGTNETRSFKALNNATGVLETVEITTPVFYGDLSEYRGKVNGGLNYTVSTDASYEIGGQVFSAYQRNEMVIRGSFYRGGYIADPTVIAGLKPTSTGASS